MLLLVVVRVQEVPGEGRHGLGIVQSAGRGLTGLADDGPGGQLETVSLSQHDDFSSPAGVDP
jgi:hypothetical protein